jgi:transketolase
LKFLPTLEQLIVMSVVPGKSGQKYIEATHEKMTRVMNTLNENKFQGYVEADGGVTQENIGSCFTDGARAFVGGSAIIGQNDIRGVIREFRDATLKVRRQALVNKAIELGGSELVNKWIDLHQIGDKKDQLIKMAKEAGYI